MEASELRIGNIYKTKNCVSKITALDLVDIESGKYKIEPEILTPEWLIKFGGQEDKNKDIYISVNKDNDLRIYLSKVGILICKDYFCPLFGYPHIIYVHQLQNLFYAITGEELKTV
jgi:hypothetical protein